MEFTATERGARMLIRKGFLYVFQKERSNNLQSKECLLRHKGECKPKVKLHMNGELVGEINEHTHPPSQDQTEITKIKTSIKQRSRATHDTPPTNFGSCPSEYFRNSCCQPAANQ